MRYAVQYGSGPSLDVDADTPVLAWDAYKRRTGLRRRPGDEPPTILIIPKVLAVTPPDLEAVASEPMPPADEPEPE